MNTTLRRVITFVLSALLLVSIFALSGIVVAAQGCCDTANSTDRPVWLALETI